jgi:uncharacterized protein (TIGR02266 family)
MFSAANAEVIFTEETSAEMGAMGRSTVLIVANRHPSPELNTQFLQHSDLRIVTCAAGAGVLSAIRRERPQLIIEDLACGESTDCVCGRLKNDPATEEIPVILVSPPERIPEARETHPDELLCKPLIPTAFYQAVRRFVPLPQRTQLRHAVNLRFTFTLEGRTVQAFSRDISLSGAFLKTDRIPHPGTHLDLCFALPGDTVAIRCGGRVRRIDEKSNRKRDRGIGIEFERIRDDELERLEAYITRSQYRAGFFR